VLESYGEQGNLQAVLAGTRVTATFDSAEDEVTGSAGCNTYFGDYQISGNDLSIPMIANTEMYCLEPEGVMEQENRYLSAMRAAENYQIQNGKLRITAGSRVLVFIAE
jgi:heat shock protein HslJ